MGRSGVAAGRIRPGAEPRSDAGLGDRLRLTVRIHDHVSVPPASLSRAKQTAGYVFETIGVEPVWLDCPPHREETAACSERPARGHLFAMIVPKPNPTHARASAAFGLAVQREGGEGSHLYVFHDRVQGLAAQRPELDGATVLGHVLAHEIGHLLLGSNSHSAGGLMSGRWFGKELRRMARGDLLFLPPERQRIRAALTARRAEEAASIRR